MTTTSPVITKKSLGLASLAAFGACAACCAIPLLAAAGVGGGLLSAVAGYMRPGMDLAVASIVGVSVVGAMAFRARTRNAAACASACEVGGGCGCGPEASNELLSTPTPKAGAPIVCTADLRDKPTVQGQLNGYRSAFQHLLRTERFENGARWVFANRPSPDRLDAAQRTRRRYQLGPSYPAVRPAPPSPAKSRPPSRAPAARPPLASRVAQRSAGAGV